MMERFYLLKLLSVS